MRGVKVSKIRRRREGKELVAVRLPPKLKEKCLLLADAEEITFSEWLREVLRREVKEHQKSA